MNIKVIVGALLIGVLLPHMDAARSKSGRKKTSDRDDTSELTASSSSRNDDGDRHKEDRGHEHELHVHKAGDKQDRRYSSSSSSEEDDKDGKNETTINFVPRIHRKRESKFIEERHIK
ncbi:hypothetical protein LOAG_08434 [Loa loa]|uniref:Secreted phosphoprotein 1 n=1 Tax=Loa loa TaxID=7209 RepID=A0A1I7V7D1_LOALO|nr:hypothetical protein LOAG_08434 [Loa loa]EFO20055.2 hypothetical protein LOAG_08434 [Loa loa]